MRGQCSPKDTLSLSFIPNKNGNGSQLVHSHCSKGGFLGGIVVKHPANAGDAVPSMGWEDPLEKAMATHSSIVAWKIPWTEEPGGPSIGLQREGHN